MEIFTDSPRFAARVLPDTPPDSWTRAETGPDTARLLRAFLREPVWRADPPSATPFGPILVTESADGSNYDRLIELIRDGHPLPHRLACVAGSGRGFHGFKDRPWSAVPGNLHLSVHLAPRRPVERFEVAFMALAAVSVVDALDRVPGLAGKGGIRWVNDVLLDGAKVGGVLAYTHAMHTTVHSAVLGIGVNVETTPSVEPTPFVPAVTTVRAHARTGEGLLGPVLRHVLDALDDNERTLRDRGYRALVDRYRDRSVVVGRRVVVCDERSNAEPLVLSRGTVRAIGDGLELLIEGLDTPVTRGRIIMDDGPKPSR